MATSKDRFSYRQSMGRRVCADCALDTDLTLAGSLSYSLQTFAPAERSSIFGGTILFVSCARLLLSRSGRLCDAIEMTLK